MRYMNPSRFTRLVRLLKAGDYAIPADVHAYAQDGGFDVDAILPADRAADLELFDLLAAARIDPADVMSVLPEGAPEVVVVKPVRRRRIAAS